MSFECDPDPTHSGKALPVMEIHNTMAVGLQGLVTRKGGVKRYYIYILRHWVFREPVDKRQVSQRLSQFFFDPDLGRESVILPHQMHAILTLFP